MAWSRVDHIPKAEEVNESNRYSLAEVESPAITCDLDTSLNCLRSVGSTPPAPFFPIVMISDVNANGNHIR